jgi:nucleolar protein 9
MYNYLDAVLESDDRIGSHVGDRCWAFADTYLKVHPFSLVIVLVFIKFTFSFQFQSSSQEKIARSLIPYEQFLAASYYGKYFAQQLNLYLLQCQLEEWKTIQADQK